MKKAIYKYENKINHKIYIGQTNDVNRRFKEHLSSKSFRTSLIEKAIQKYGIDNFDFTVLEWTENYNEQEKYWIEFYNCYKPYGYNICEGGGYLPNQQKEKHSNCSISEKIARQIQKDLMNFNIPRRQIVKKYHVSVNLVESINSGHTWNYYNLNYPLRPTETELNEKKAIEVIKLLKETSLNYKEIGQKVGWSESQIRMINRGENHPQKNEHYPIRPNPFDHTDKIEACIILLKQNKTNTEIANILNTSSAWVSRINNGKTHKQDNIQYPIRK